MLRRLFIFIALFFGSVISAQTFKPMKDTISFKQKVEKMSSVTKSIQADFTQVKDLSLLSEKVVSKGTFVFKKENQLRWEYRSPYPYIIVINYNTILIKDDKNKVKKYDMNSNKVFKEINEIMVSSVNGDILKSKKFKLSYLESEEAYKVELIPLTKTVKENLKKIDMYFDKSVTSVTRLEMTENGGDLTSIEFYNKKINAPIKSDMFLIK